MECPGGGQHLAPKLVIRQMWADVIGAGFCGSIIENITIATKELITIL
jgi:hypothetical protein